MDAPEPRRRFSSLSIQGFRRLYDFETELKPMMVLIGANSVGKTSLLEAWSLVAASADGRLQQTVSDMGGFGAILSNGSSDPMVLDLRMPVAGHEPIDYRLELTGESSGFQISKEKLSQYQPRGGRTPEHPFLFIQSERNHIHYYDPDSKGLVQPTWEHDDRETSLSQVPKLFVEPERFRRILSSTTLYHVLDVGAKAPVRMPQPMRPAKLPGANGEELTSCLFSMSQTCRDRFERIEEILKAGFPSFERLEFPPVAAGTLALTWKDENFKQPFYMNQLSEGTLRFLWLVTLLQSPGLPEVTMIDEPEVSLHPELLELFVEVARDASLRTQLIIATHHDRLIRFLKPEEILVMDIDGHGWASAAWGNEMDIEAWAQDYSLDELWRLGRLGGRP